MKSVFRVSCFIVGFSLLSSVDVRITFGVMFVAIGLVLTSLERVIKEKF